MRFPEVAKRIAILITQTAKRIDIEVAQVDSDESTKKEKMGGIRKFLNADPWSKGNDTLHLTKFQYRLAWVLGMSLVFLPAIILLIVLYLPAAHGQDLVPSLVALLIAWLILGVFLFCLSSVGRLVVRFSDRFVAGRAVGTLGIIIAGFGVLGEAYQFTALMLT